MTSFLLKLIALITMFFDHFGDLIIGHLSIFNVIGRIAFPIFAFQLVIGYLNTKNIKKYIIRLTIFALISQIPFSIMMNRVNNYVFTLNIFFTLILGLFTLISYNKIKNKLLKVLAIILLIYIGNLINVDYGSFGVFLIFYIYLFYPKFNNIKFLQDETFFKYFIFIFGYLLLCILKYSSYFGIFSNAWVYSIILFAFFPIILMILYNGKKGKSFKYFFYAFYPLHLIILCFINMLIN